tara:strand:+ start:1193 stop:2041 length:849 start_codon:yes stop_codon:yes gene_type:complete
MPDISTSLGIIGYPISHSISPIFQQAGINHNNFNETYKSYEVHPDQLKDFMLRVRKTKMIGLNVTVPHKTSVISYLDDVDEWAVRAGAVNTIVRNGDVLKGYNTDGFGFMEGLYRNTNVSIDSINVLILGAGGSARAVLLSLMDAGAKSICIANRTLSKAELLKTECENNVTAVDVVATEDPKFVSYVENAGLIINCTTIGMKNTEGKLPFTSENIREDTILYDLVYNPLRTLMLNEGEKVNCTRIGGIDMLVYQGVKSFELWFESKAPVEIMLRAAKSVVL